MLNVIGSLIFNFQRKLHALHISIGSYYHIVAITPALTKLTQI